MFGHFYNEGMRKMTVAFGQVFNNITIKRTGADSTRQSIRVPLAYAPKEKFLVRLDQQPSLDEREFAITLPRMGFEISDIAYDGSRKLTKVQKFKTTKTNSGVMNFNYMPVPYNISYNLYCFTATAEGGLQIVEQILPYFQPDYTVTINVVPEMGIKRDVPIVLNNINYEDSYSGDFETRRAVIYTLNFTAKTYLFGPMSNQKVVKKVQADLGADTETPLARDERIIVVPDPSTANADDDFGFTTTLDFFADGKRFNPKTGNDE